MFHIVRDLWRLLRSWWLVDRVRIAHREGELLRLGTSSVLGIDGRWWTVESRAVGEGPRGPFVRYLCSDGASHAFLEVRPAPPFGAESIVWICDGTPHDLHPAEIEVYAMSA